MKAILKIAIACIFLLISFNSANSQDKDNFVRDVELSAKLRKYLIDHIDIYTIDSLGKKMPFDSNYLQEEYGNVVIRSYNLKSDSIITNKQIIGFYKFSFACYSGCRPHLYIQYPNKIEFIDLDSKSFSLKKIIKKINRFFKKYPNDFTLEEKVKTIEGVMNTIYYNKFARYGCW